MHKYISNSLVTTFLYLEPVYAKNGQKSETYPCRTDDVTKSKGNGLFTFIFAAKSKLENETGSVRGAGSTSPLVPLSIAV